MPRNRRRIHNSGSSVPGQTQAARQPIKGQSKEGANPEGAIVGETTSSGSDDATASYRGYRLQALYTLHRLLVRGIADGLALQPEGNKDVALLKPDGIPTEVSQIKAYTSDLVLSSFRPNMPNSFFYRMDRVLAADPRVEVRIVSFGTVGPELKGALAGPGRERKSVAAKLARYGRITQDRAEQILASIELVEVREHLLREDIRGKSRRPLPEPTRKRLSIC